MVIHEYKIVFIHIPKTAGVAITHMLLPHIVGYDTTKEIGRLSDDLKIRFELRGQQKHKRAKFYVFDGDITQEQWAAYYKFAIVRNPWDRAVSEFAWRHTLPTRRPSKSFGQFLLYCKSRIADCDNRNRDIYWAHAQPQSSFVTNLGTNRVILDEIFRFENLSRVVDVLSGKVGASLRLRKLNDSCHRGYRQYYNNSTREMVRELYAKDIDKFKYTF